jgi:ribosomal protein S18 acetylase RimI-like enzyme
VVDPGVAERIREAWRAELRAPAAFRRPGRHLHRRVGEDDPGRGPWVSVVTLGGATCVSLPATAPAWLEELGRRHLDADLTDAATVARLVGPVTGFRGPASLAFLDPAGATARHDPRVAWAAAGGGPLRRLAAACGPEDAEESGILAADSPVAVWRDGARVAAACGYQVWHGRLAHLSVLVDPADRGRGLGTAVAAAAVRRALDAGLVPQWRARLTLVASRRIAASLGFVELGRQATFRLAAPAPPAP